MIVYGDGARELDPRQALMGLQVALGENPHQELPILRHGRLASAFIEAAEIAQGIADSQFARAGEDRPSATIEAAILLVQAIARCLVASWDSGFEAVECDIGNAMQALLAHDLPANVTCNRAEGYAFYALYPEAFHEAGKALACVSPLTIIGIRSIGLGLASVVANAAGAPPPLSVRPVGHPFERKLALSAEIEAAIVSAAGHVAVVDEGPGLSGSSFAAVLDRLEDGGVPLARIDVFPSHSGDLGHQASDKNRTRWGKVSRHVVAFEPLLLHNADPRRRLEAWFDEISGPACEPLQDLSGGLWRALHYANETQWPAANLWGERRKYLLRSASGQFLLKFSGLGRYGSEKLGLATALAEAGFSPPTLGLRHGFAISPWVDGQPVDPQRIERGRLLARLSDYLGFRAGLPQAAAETGASLEQLGFMLAHNAQEGVASFDPASLRRLCSHMAGRETRVRRVATDNRLHAWEWLETPDGALLKTDAIDHCVGHDLIGCQDISWDIAGARAEFALSDEETTELATRVGTVSAYPVDPDLLRFMVPCYLAFQLGAASMARDSLGGAPAEAARFEGEGTRYRLLLEKELELLA